jgi:hypothetical protein
VNTTRMEDCRGNILSGSCQVFSGPGLNEELEGLISTLFCESRNHKQRECVGETHAGQGVFGP